MVKTWSFSHWRLWGALSHLLLLPLYFHINGVEAFGPSPFVVSSQRRSTLAFQNVHSPTTTTTTTTTTAPPPPTTTTTTTTTRTTMTRRSAASTESSMEEAASVSFWGHGKFQNYQGPLILAVGTAEAEEQTAFLEAWAADLQESTHLSTRIVHYVENLRQEYMKEDCLVIFLHWSSTPVEEAEQLDALSDYKVCLDSTADDPEDVLWLLQRLVARALLPQAIPGSTATGFEMGSFHSPHTTFGEHSFFCSLSFPSMTDNNGDLQNKIVEICSDVDAMEFRVDLLECREDAFAVVRSLQQLLLLCRPNAARAPALPLGNAVLEDAFPLVYTVRSAHQAGTWPDDRPEDMFRLLDLGLRCGVEVLDVEAVAWDAALVDHLLQRASQRYASLILGSHHVVGQEEETTVEEAVPLFLDCALNGRAHAAKVVLSTTQEDADRTALEASMVAQAAWRSQPDAAVLPCISLMLGEAGQYSRVLNTCFTPVTHAALPKAAAPGQMTASEILTARIVLHHLIPQKFAIVGHQIAYSVSPAMHSAAFAATKLPHSYVLLDMPNVEELVQSDLWKDDAFGGTSVTIPHKQAIIPHLDALSDAARDIGAVNTVIVQQVLESNDETDKSPPQWRRVLRGDNTDWRGMYNPIRRRLSLEPNGGGFALILGAGGTARAAAYAARELGLERIYYNRTPEKALDLQQSFGGTVVTDLDMAHDDSKKDASLLDQDGLGGGVPFLSLGTFLAQKEARAGNDSPPPLLRVVMSTLPASANFTLPEWLVQEYQERELIVLDVNYKPYHTTLLTQASLYKKWQCIRGSEMLWEQGVGQFELWTQRSAPYGIMKGVVLKNCLPKEAEEEEEEEES